MFGMFDCFSETYRDFERLSALCLGSGDIVALGRQRLARPHCSDRRAKGAKAKARRRAKANRRNKRKR